MEEFKFDYVLGGCKLCRHRLESEHIRNKAEYHTKSNVLAAMSSSSSDDVTPFVSCPSVFGANVVRAHERFPCGGRRSGQ